MLLVILYCGFYLSGLLIARWVTLARQALLSGLSVTVAAAAAALTLWLLTRAGLTEAWLSIAMAGTIVLPAVMIGLGLLAGAWVRTSGRSAPSIAVAAAPIVLAVLVPFL